jgi:hypothetical protein
MTLVHGGEALTSRVTASASRGSARNAASHSACPYTDRRYAVDSTATVRVE